MYVQGRDPTVYELVLKTSAVQRRLIKKTEQLIAREAELRDVARVNRELKKQLSRRPGPDVGQQLSRCRDTVTARNRQIKARLFTSPPRIRPVFTLPRPAVVLG